ncbi:carbamoyltransferase HypF [candidate division WOR-3 bacterium RBG_13_43_14]|uniref:Carbamoyltransferase n=1 Tax=candidate division WOR-3 bacterium RBG_13_43_14 TaxID=1802590 RepID=A0A1F4UGU9_UNCW3|nr:MAG: carbamoyltransferase HypF [candidate division WOR-3 bacterium RBG_13_43_14]
MRERRKVIISGVVQGVGFRPFIYRLANDRGLTGFIRNTSKGVDIEVEGSADKIRIFLTDVRTRKPVAANIYAIRQHKIRLIYDKGFRIVSSRIEKGFTQISPDIATCSACYSEFMDRKDRRYLYPFINCTNCGPRYSIIINTPYDRRSTSMKEFEMCPQCQHEFEDVDDRRFHAQPDCCELCGPQYSLFTSKNRLVNGDPIKNTIRLLKKGEIIAIKGIGGFHIACDARQGKTIERLRKLKNRPTKPFAIMVGDSNRDQVAYISRAEHSRLLSPPAPILLLRKKPHNPVNRAVAPNNPYIGIIAPYVPMHYMLLDQVPFFLMTSANRADEPIAFSREQVMANLSGIVSFCLDHDRDIENRCDDSVGYVASDKKFMIIRRSRGLAPAPLTIPFQVKPSLGVGPFLKNTFTLANKSEAYMSPHIGDLDNLETMVFYKEMTQKYQRWFKIEPELIVHDMHPEYLSTKIANDLPGKKIAVQHHVAHIAAVLAENSVNDKVIGIAYDGTGYGEDGRIWGGEFFAGTIRNLKRAAHLRYLPLPGGEVSIIKPYRIAIAYYYKLLGQKIGRNKWRTEARSIWNMIDKNIGLVETSSMGRLFDCVAGLIGVTEEITYEAEAAINLEYMTKKGVKTFYQYAIEDNDIMIIDPSKILKGILYDLKKGIDPGVISAKFHNTVTEFTLDMVQRLAGKYSTDKICLSGGVFQNRYLLERIIDRIRTAGFKVYLHQNLPTNDGCISYGQVVYGNMRERKERI